MAEKTRASTKTKKSDPKPLISKLLILTAFLILVNLLYSFYLNNFAKDPQIFEIQSSHLVPGPTTLSGTLTQVERSFFLTLPSSQLVMVDQPGISNFLGKDITVTGILVPPLSLNDSPLLAEISSLIVNQ